MDVGGVTLNQKQPIRSIEATDVNSCQHKRETEQAVGMEPTSESVHFHHHIWTVCLHLSESLATLAARCEQDIQLRVAAPS